MSDDINPPANTETEETITGEEAKKLRERAQRFEGLLKTKEEEFKKFTSIYKDIDADEARSLKAEKERLEKELLSKDPAKQEEFFNRKLEKLRGDLESQVNQFKQENETLKRQNKTLTVTKEIMKDIGALFNDDVQDLVQGIIEKSCDRDEDGTFVVKDENGEVIYKGNRPMTPRELADELIVKKPSLAKASVQTGGGKDATGGTPTHRKFRVPSTYAELQAMPNSAQVWENLSLEEKQKISKTMKL